MRTMLFGSPATAHNSRTNKRVLVLVGFVFVFLLASVAIGLRASNASMPYSKGCHGGGDGGEVTCTTSFTVSQTTSTVTVTTGLTTTSTSTDAQTSSTQLVDNSPIVPTQSVCSALNGIGYQVLAAGTQLTIAFNGNSQMTFTVPSQSFTWNWYWVPATGIDANTLSQQITTAMWANGHGQNFSFFIAQLNGQSGLVLQTDYSLAQACA
jgi:hypothetical protein